MKYLRFRIDGVQVKLSADLASKGQIAIAYGRLHKCESCGRDDVYGLKPVPSSPLPALVCSCGTSYAGELS